MTDFHTHILPGIDDGSANIAESLAMLNRYDSQRIGAVVATPHFDATADTPSAFLKRRQRAMSALASAVANDDSVPTIYCGAEVCYYDGISRSDELAKLVVEGTSLVLVEMPMCRWSDRMVDEVAYIYEITGLTPIIAHIDRYMVMLKEKHLAEGFFGLPVLVQANTSFFLNRRTSALAMKLLKDGLIHLVGSDCHNTDTRPPNLNEAARLIEKKAGRRTTARIEELESRIFSGEQFAAEELTL